jgi:hypothetical protein
MKAILLSFICIFLAVTRAEVALASPEEGHLGAMIATAGMAK